MKPRKLLVLISDYLSVLYSKGELITRYYNPGNLFDEVHIVMTNDDQVDPTLVNFTVGNAKLYVHALGDSSFFWKFNRHFLPHLHAYTRRAVNLIRSIEPSLIRSYGAKLNGHIAAHAKKVLGIPFVASLHNNPDQVRSLTPWWPEWRFRVILSIHQFIERTALTAADVVAAVYIPCVPYAKRLGARDVRVLYNVLNPDHITRKMDYSLHKPPRLLTVGQQINGKNPEAIIRTLTHLDDAVLTVIGCGPLHDHLRQVARECGVDARVLFIEAIPNDQLVSSLPDYDLFVAHNIYVGVAKAVLEPLLTGLPVIISKREEIPNPELDGDWVMNVENTPKAYASTIKRLLSDHSEREALGRRAWEHANARYHPRITEQAYADLYRELVPGL